jgi:membrane protease YdiL (CAAX protease family)/uncharacterized RDD family membrane protein YckC
MQKPNYATFWRRTLASLLDNAVWLLFLFWIYVWIVEGAFAVSDAAGILATLAFFSLWFNYFAFCEWRWGQTIGKNATGIEVRSIDRAPRLTYGQASIRNLLRLIDFFVIGEVMIATDERKQRLGDKAANTVVLRRARMKRVAPGGAPSHDALAPISGGAGADPVAPEPTAPPAPPPPKAAGVAPVPWSTKTTVQWLLGGLLLAIIVPPLLVAPFDPDLESDGALLVAQALFDGLLLCVALGVASDWRFRPLARPLRLLGMRPFRLSAIWITLGTLVTYYIAAGLFASLVLKPDQEDIGGDLGVGNPSIVIAVAAVLMIVLLAPVAEELFFRGFLFAGLRSRWSLWPAAITSGLIFGLVHAPTGITTVVPLAALGFALCWLYNRTGSLWPCVIAHMINNGLALAVVS